MNRLGSFWFFPFRLQEPVSNIFLALSTCPVRNALGISYITGEGENAYSHPHNRSTECDGIDEPMPGWVSGGPLEKLLDPAIKAAVPEGTPPMKCYVDDSGSYSSNEITIYWNSPVVFMCACFNRPDSDFKPNR